MHTPSETARLVSARGIIQWNVAESTASGRVTNRWYSRLLKTTAAPPAATCTKSGKIRSQKSRGR